MIITLPQNCVEEVVTIVLFSDNFDLAFDDSTETVFIADNLDVVE